MSRQEQGGTATASVEGQNPNRVLGEGDDPLTDVEVQPDVTVPGGRRAMADPDDLASTEGDPADLVEQQRTLDGGTVDEDEGPTLEADPADVAEQRRDY
jgi:hypothetical protein